jgi:hypothetical protein
MMKKDDLSAEHLEWLIESRAKNQRTSGNLYRLLEEHEDQIRDTGRSREAQSLVAISFSLWRAAFLADKTGKKFSVFDDAKLFLGKMLIDNAINYSQDRAAREWTFNYYISVAEDHLNTFFGSVDGLEEVLGGDWQDKSLSYAKRRWDRCQAGLDMAVKHLLEALIST